MIAKRTKGNFMKIIFRFLTVSALLLGQTQFATHADEAMLSKKAMRSLLLDVTRAGNRVVAVGERGHIIYSDDDGKTWYQAKAPSSAMLTAVFFADEKNGWAVGHDSKILATDDGGNNWTIQHKSEKIDESQPFLDVWFKDKNFGFAVGAYGGILHTDDGGKNWDDWSENISNEEQLHYNGISGRSDGTVFIVGEQGMIFRSNNNGESWTKLTSPYEGSLFSVLAVKNSSVVFVCGLQGHVFKSTNNGNSWERIKTGITAGLVAENQLDDGSILITGNGGNVLRATNETADFSLITRADRQAVMSVVSTRSPWLVSVGEGGVKLVSPDGSSPDTH